MSGGLFSSVLVPFAACRQDIIVLIDDRSILNIIPLAQQVLAAGTLIMWWINSFVQARVTVTRYCDTLL